MLQESPDQPAQQTSRFVTTTRCSVSGSSSSSVERLFRGHGTISVPCLHRSTTRVLTVLVSMVTISWILSSSTVHQWLFRFDRDISPGNSKSSSFLTLKKFLKGGFSWLQMWNNFETRFIWLEITPYAQHDYLVVGNVSFKTSGCISKIYRIAYPLIESIAKNALRTSLIIVFSNSVIIPVTNRKQKSNMKIALN